MLPLGKERDKRSAPVIQRATTVSNEASGDLLSILLSTILIPFIYEEKNRGRKTRERTIQETRTRFEVLFTIYSIKPRERIETRISSRNIDFFRSKKSHISFVLVRDIRSNVIIGRASRKKWERKSHGRRARDTRDTQTVSEKSSAPK